MNGFSTDKTSLTSENSHRGSHDPLSFDNSQNSGKCYACGYSFYIKDMNQDQTKKKKKKEMNRARFERVPHVSSVSSECFTLQAHGVRHQPGSYLNHDIQSFHWGFIIWAWLIESLAMWLNSISKPSFLWGGHLIMHNSKPQLSHGFSGMSSMRDPPWIIQNSYSSEIPWG